MKFNTPENISLITAKSQVRGNFPDLPYSDLEHAIQPKGMISCVTVELKQPLEDGLQNRLEAYAKQLNEVYLSILRERRHAR